MDNSTLHPPMHNAYQYAFLLVRVILRAFFSCMSTIIENHVPDNKIRDIIEYALEYDDDNSNNIIPLI